MSLSVTTAANPSSLNPVIVRANALGKPDSLAKPHPLTQALGRTRTKRHDWYPALFHAAIDADGLSDIRAACQTDTPLGNDTFKAKIERKLHCKLGQARAVSLKGLTKGSDLLSFLSIQLQNLFGYDAIVRRRYTAIESFDIRYVLRVGLRLCIRN